MGTLNLIQQLKPKASSSGAILKVTDEYKEAFENNQEWNINSSNDIKIDYSPDGKVSQPIANVKMFLHLNRNF